MSVYIYIYIYKDNMSIYIYTCFNNLKNCRKIFKDVKTKSRRYKS